MQLFRQYSCDFTSNNNIAIFLPKLPTCPLENPVVIFAENGNIVLFELKSQES